MASDLVHKMLDWAKLSDVEQKAVRDAILHTAKNEIDKTIDAITQIKDWKSILDWKLHDCFIENPPYDPNYLLITIRISFDGPNPDPIDDSFKKRMVGEAHCQISPHALLATVDYSQVANILGMEAQHLGQKLLVDMLQAHGTDYSNQMEAIVRRHKEMMDDMDYHRMCAENDLKRYEEHRRKQEEIERLRRYQAKLDKQKQRKKIAPWGVN